MQYGRQKGFSSKRGKKLRVKRIFLELTSREQHKSAPCLRLKGAKVLQSVNDPLLNNLLVSQHRNTQRGILLGIKRLFCFYSPQKHQKTKARTLLGDKNSSRKSLTVPKITLKNFFNSKISKFEREHPSEQFAILYKLRKILALGKKMTSAGLKKN